MKNVKCKVELRNQRISSIDGLRGLAALAVVLLHARASWWVGITETFKQNGFGFNIHAWIGYLTAPLSFGGLGVCLFFVISGYCIHKNGALLLLKSSRNSIDFKRFFARRFWRIYPTYVAALLFTAVVDLWALKYADIREPNQDNSLYAFAISLMTLQGYAAPYFGTNGVFWTLAMEIHLYIVYPILFYISKKTGPVTAVVFTLSLAIFYIIANSALHIDSSLPHRGIAGPIFIPFWYNWSIGFLIAEIQVGRVRDFKPRIWMLLFICSLLASLLLDYLKTDQYISNIAWSSFFACTLRLSIYPESKILWRTYPGRFFIFIGMFSYTLYALHGPILHALHIAVDPVFQSKYKIVYPSIIVSGVTVVMCFVAYYLVEYWTVDGRKKDRSHLAAQTQGN